MKQTDSEICNSLYKFDLELVKLKVKIVNMFEMKWFYNQYMYYNKVFFHLLVTGF